MTQGVIIGLIALFAPLVLACTSSDESAGPTATPRPEPSRRGNKLIDGEISFKGLTNSIANGTIYVRLEDVSIEDEAVKTLAEQVISEVSVDSSNPPTLKYLIEHREVQGKDTYKLRIHVDADNSGDVTEGDYARTVSYLGSMAVGASSLNTINVTVEQVIIEASDETKALLRVESPIEEVRVSRSPDDPDTYIASVTSIQPNACAKPNGYEVARKIKQTDHIGIWVYNVAPASQTVSCAQVVSTVESNVVFGLKFEPSETSTVYVNNDTFFFTAGDTPTLKPVRERVPTFPAIKGTIDFVGVNSPISDAMLYIRFEDISRPDLGTRVTSERVIPDFTTEAEDPGRYRYVIQYTEPRPYGQYNIAVHLDVDNSGDVNPGDYVTTARYPFIGKTPPNRINVRANEVE